MTAETLRSVALETLDNYRRTAKFAVNALRLGSANGIALVDATVGNLIAGYEGNVSQRLKDSIDGAQERINAAADMADETVGKLGGRMRTTLTGAQKRIASATKKADGTVDKLLSGASRRLAKFPGRGTPISKLLDNNVVASVESLGMPGVRLLRAVSSTLADGAEKLSTKAAGGKRVGMAKRNAGKKATAVRRVRAKRA